MVRVGLSIMNQYLRSATEVCLKPGLVVERVSEPIGTDSHRNAPR